MNLPTFTAFGSSFLFGCGLTVSGMADPLKIKGFLNIFGQWDPSLCFVIIPAIAVHSLSYRFIKRRSSPLIAPYFVIPQKNKIDRQLLLGSALFGIGWGMSGFCPGPAILSLGTLSTPPILFVISMISGMLLFQGTYLAVPILRMSKR